MTGASELRWCADCGAEHEPWAEACVFCGGSLSTSPLESTGSAVDRSVVELDVSEFGRADRATIELLLRAEDLPYQFTRTRLLVPGDRIADVEAMVADVRAPFDPDLEPPGLLEAAALAPDAVGDEPGPVPASLARRLLARIVGWVLWALVTTVATGAWLVFGVDAWDPAYMPVLELYVVVEVVLVARSGTDIGKSLAGMAVVTLEGDLPGWWRAAVRSAVAFGPAVLTGYAGWSIEYRGSAGTLFASVGAVWLLLVLGSVALDPDRRGWHDRAAGTRVVV